MRKKLQGNALYTDMLAKDVRTLFNISKPASENLQAFMRKHSLFYTLKNQVAGSEEKVYTIDVELPGVGTLTVTRDKENNIVDSTICLTDAYKDELVKTMDGESSLTTFLDDCMIEAIRNRYNDLLGKDRTYDDGQSTDN